MLTCEVAATKTGEIRMIRRLHHVGLVVPDLRAALAAYARMPGTSVGEPFEIPERRYLLAYVDFGNALIELTQPLTADSVAGRLLAANPNGGLNHLAFEVDAIIEDRDRLVGEGATPMGSAEPATDRFGAKVVVLDARETHGTLFELRQPG
jgi:methylmalonyl-CoA/ethylmalonyl-CoA epimerase